MTKGKRQVPVFLLTLLMAAFIWSCGQLPMAAAGDTQAVKEDGRVVVAKVNGKPIYEDQLNQQVEVMLSRFNKHGMHEPSPELLRLKREQVLNKLIDNALIYQASQILNVPDMDKKIDKRIGEIRKGPHASKLEGRSDAELRDSIRSQIFLDEYLEKKGIARPVVPEEDIKAYYEKNQASFIAKESVKVRHILVKAGEDAKPEEKERARKKIDKARQMILGGKDFAEVAKEYSECDSATAGGDLGYVEKGFMPPEFDKVAFSLEPGRLSEIVQTKFGYHVLEVTDRKPEGVVPYDDKVKGFIEKFLQGDLKRQKLASHIQDLRAKAKIEIFVQ
jgi:peptidyl-prolyl cis-trans isomerase C